ncbi:MAG: hypothetical protein VCA12_16730 [Pseudomonadales bacterium]|jgi:hypothetical protein
MCSFYSGLNMRRDRFSNNGSGVTCVSGRSDRDFGLLCSQEAASFLSGDLVAMLAERHINVKLLF